MKLYIFPVEKECNASCRFCITKHRNLYSGFLDADSFEKSLNNLSIEKIEITGGGEPFLHPNLEKIVHTCLKYFPTQLYTNGSLIRGNEDFAGLDYFCISRAHYSDSNNKKIMGISQNIKEARKFKIPIKFSLLLHKNGINNPGDVVKYFNWAEKVGASKVVVRQLIPGEGSYKAIFLSEFVSAKEVFDNLKIKTYTKSKEGADFDYKDMEVSFKYTPVSCECENLFLHANGLLGGTHDIDRKRD